MLYLLENFTSCRIDDKGDKTITASKLVADEGMGPCIKVSGLEGLQPDQVIVDKQMCVSMYINVYMFTIV